MLNRTSRTAQHVALFRAIETARRDRVIDDPYATAFLTGRYGMFARLARLPVARRLLERYIDGRFPGGPRASAVARTRLIDELVDEAGAGQVVLLGAGYDSRAYRLPAMRSARVFEVDHPATQATKRRVVGARVEAGRRAHVRFVAVDLLRDDLGQALVDAGFDRDERTIVIWEGVTNYLTAEAVDSTLQKLAGLAVAGSRIVFTYVDRAALDGTGSFQGVWQDAVRKQGEPWTFGLDPEAVPGYLAERGMDLDLDVSTREAADRYLVPLGRREPAAPFYRIAQAEVRTKGGEVGEGPPQEERRRKGPGEELSRPAGSGGDGPRRAGSGGDGPRRAGSGGDGPRRAGSGGDGPRRAGSGGEVSRRAGSGGEVSRGSGSRVEGQRRDEARGQGPRGGESRGNEKRERGSRTEEARGPERHGGEPRQEAPRVAGREARHPRPQDR